MKMEKTECSETSAHKIQTPGNNSEETIQLVFLSSNWLLTHILRERTFILLICPIFSNSFAELFLRIIIKSC